MNNNTLIKVYTLSIEEKVYLLSNKELTQYTIPEYFNVEKMPLDLLNLAIGMTFSTGIRSNTIPYVGFSTN
jgi:hypothetical protein